MPAAAVIPAPIAYIKVVAVKKLVVGFWVGATGPPFRCALVASSFLPGTASGIHLLGVGVGVVTLSKLECSKQACALHTLAWNNIIGLWFYFVGFRNRSND